MAMTISSYTLRMIVSVINQFESQLFIVPGDVLSTGCVISVTCLLKPKNME